MASEVQKDTKAMWDRTSNIVDVAKDTGPQRTRTASIIQGWPVKA
jgi:hypothetical protein